MNRAFYEMIYEYYSTQILFGHIKYGEKLPSIEHLCYKFQVAPQTIRNMLYKLKKNGFIEISSGKKATVVYKTSNDEVINYINDYYVKRIEAIRDINEIAPLMIHPMLKKAYLLLDKEDMNILYNSIKNTDPKDTYLSFTMGSAILEKLNNKLAMNLFNEIILFYKFPYFDNKSDNFLSYTKKNNIFILEKNSYKNAIKNILISCKNHNADAFLKNYLMFENILLEDIKIYIKYPNEQSPLPTKQIPFIWHIYRDRPQKCYSVAEQIIGGIYKGTYKINSFLPSFNKMGKKYKVSFSTIRRTINLLSTLGIVKTIPRKGTKVSVENIDIKNFNNKTIIKNIKLGYESLEILKLNSKEMNEYIFSKFTNNDFENIKGKIILLDNKKSLDIILAYLENIILLTKSEFIKMVYTRHFALILWLYPINIIYEEKEIIDINHFLNILDKRDANAFSDIMVKLLINIQDLTKSLLQKKE